MVIDGLSAYIQDPSSGSFDSLALAALQGAGASSDPVRSWRDVPPLPAAAFHLAEPAAARASHPDPDLHRRIIDASFPRFCLPPSGAPLPILSLIPAEPASRLSFWADHLLARYGSPASAAACGPRGVETARARSWAGGRQREGRPVLVLATAATLRRWLELLERQDLRFRLPAGSAAVEVAGCADPDAPARSTLLAHLHERLGLPAGAVVRAYGKPEQTSLCFTRALAGGDPDLFVAPPWVRVRALDPATLAEAPPGTPGRLAVFDLANAGLPLHLLTEDVGQVEGAGFRLIGS